MENIKQYTSYTPQARLDLNKSGKTDDQIADLWARNNKGLAMNLENIRRNSNSDPKATTAFMNMYLYGDAEYSPVQVEEVEEDTSLGFLGSNAAKRFLNNTWSKTNQFMEKERDIIDRTKRGELGIADSMVLGGINAAKGILGPASAFAETAITTDIPFTGTSAADIFGKALTPILQSDPVQEGVMPLVDEWQKFAQENVSGEILNELVSTGLRAADLYGAGIAQKPFQSVVSAVKNPIQTTKNIARGAKNTIVHPVDTFNKMTNSTPKAIVTQKITNDALKRAGVPEDMLPLITELGDNTPTYKKILDMYDARAKDIQLPNPKEAVGETAIMTYKHLDDLNKSIGGMIGNTVELNKINPVNYNNTKSIFMKWLDDNKIYVNEKNKLVGASTRVPKEDITFLQSIWDRVGENGIMRNFDDGHQTRQWLFKSQDLAQQRQAGYSDLVKDVSEKIHSSIRKDMGTISPAYSAYAKPFAKIKKAQNKFANFMGKKSYEDLLDADLKAGELAKRLTGEATDKAEDVFGTLQETAKEFGYTNQGNIKSQANFERFIRQYYPNQSLGGLQGEFEAGVKGGIGVARDIATKNYLSMTGKVINKVIGKSPEKQLELIKKFLSNSLDDISKANSPAEVEEILKNMLGEYYVPKKVRAPVKATSQVDDIIKPVQNSLDDVNIPSLTPDDANKFVDESALISKQSDDALRAAKKAEDIQGFQNYIQELDTYISTKQSMIDELPVNLDRYLDKSTGKLPEYGSTRTGKNGVKYRNEFAMRGGKIAQELGFEDAESLRSHYERITKAKDEIKSLKATRAEANAELKKLKSRGLKKEPKATVIDEMKTNKSTGFELEGEYVRQNQKNLEFAGDNMPRTAKPATTTTDLATQAKKYKSAEEFVKAQGTLPSERFTGTTGISMGKTDKIFNGNELESPRSLGFTGETVSNKVAQIKSGQRPAVTIGKNGDQIVVIDGNHTLAAYKQLGIKDIPVIDKTGDNLIKTKSQLTDIWKDANK